MGIYIFGVVLSESASKDMLRVAALTLTLVVLACLNNLLIAHSRHVHGGVYAYDSLSIVLMSESVKLCIASTMFVYSDGPVPEKISVGGYFAVPAFLYAIQNNMIFVALAHIDAPTFQELLNLRLLIVTALSTLLLKRKFSKVQWSAVVLICVGCMASRVDLFEDDCEIGGVVQEAQASTTSGMTGEFVGIMACLFVDLLSSVAGVSNELLLKTATGNINLDNMFMYIFGIIFNCILRVASGIERPFFAGFDGWAILIIMAQSTIGIVVSFILRYADSVIKGMAATFSTLLTTVLAAMIWGYEISLSFILGLFVVMMGVHLYNTNPLPKPEDVVSKKPVSGP